MTAPRRVGERLVRVEDEALLTGRGRFTDDIHLPDMLYASFVRSSHAHARILGIDTAAARAVAGVHDVITAADLPDSLRGRGLPLEVPHPAIRHPLTPRLLAVDEVNYVGEAIAVVVADSPHRAEDAASLVMVDYDPLPVVENLEAALAPGGPTAHSGLRDNLAAQFSLKHGDIDAAFAQAAHTVSARYHQHRGTGCSIEARAVLATYGGAPQGFTVWSATQAPHGVKRALMDVFQLPETRVRVIAEDVGGGFGPKVIVYPEEMVVPYCAKRLGRPVKWTEDRRENFLASTQERDQIWDVEMAVDRDARILGVKCRLLHDQGAFMPWGIIVAYISSTTFPGPYVLPAYHCDTSVVLTNKVAVTPLRGAGRQQAIFAMERTLDEVARQCGLDRAEVRRRNLIPAAAMPYDVGLTFRDGKHLVYDSGDYPRCQAMALEKADWNGFEERRRRAREQGRYIGIGLANYTEGTGLGPYDGATTRILSSGRVLLRTGAAPQGQGHRTSFAQICADELGVDISAIDVEVGDTDSVANGYGAFASRTMVTVGSSVKLSAAAVAAKIKQIAAAHFQVGEEHIKLVDHTASVCGGTEKRLTFADLAQMAAGRPGFSLPEFIEPGLEATSYFAPRQATYSNGTHVAEVEVDPDTGLVRILRYIVSHDCGRLINPLLVEGQVQGAVAHGIGNALMEKMRFDAFANPLTTMMSDYLLPDAGNVPEVEQVHLESPSPLNPLGVKGAGEGGTLPSPAAIISAVEDALAELGVRIRELPILPERICEILDAAAAQAATGGRAEPRIEP